MKTYIKNCIILFSLFLPSILQAQDASFILQRNQPQVTMDNPWSFGLGMGTSLSLKNNESGLFRGNSMATKMFGRYYFGKIGLSAATGILGGNIQENSVSQFMIDRGFSQDQIRVTKGNPMNGFLLLGPSFRFGKKVSVNADIQGGLFLNNPGNLNIALKQENRTVYQFDNGGKNYFPGFSGSISINYPLTNSTNFFINADYLQSRYSVNFLDLKNGIDVATQVNRDVKVMTAGIGIVKSFGASAGSGSRKHIGNVKYEDFRIVAENVGNCGPVTLTTTNPDGTVEKLSFACPEDAAAYTQSRLPTIPTEENDPPQPNGLRAINQINSMPSRLSMTPTTARQTQGTTFGEKVSTGLQSGAGIISGNISWQSGILPGIVTNEMAAVSSIGGTSKNGGATSSSYAAGKMMNNKSDQQLLVSSVFYVRSSNHRKANNNPYQPAFNESFNSPCDHCGIIVTPVLESSPIINAQQVKSPLYNDQGRTASNPLYGGNQKINNPIYTENGTSGSNPIYNGIATTGNGNVCGNTSHFLVGLYDPESGSLVAKTTADSCGNFWFANVPSGSYAVSITGYGTAKKTYEVSLTDEGKYDVGGEMRTGNAQLVLTLNSIENDSNALTKKVIVRGWDPKEKKSITGKAGYYNAGTQRVAGNPIGGIIVKGGKNPGGQMRAVQTDENGRFEFTGLTQGNYIINAEVPYHFNETTLITVGRNIQIWGDPHENLNGKH